MRNGNRLKMILARAFLISLICMTLNIASAEESVVFSAVLQSGITAKSLATEDITMPINMDIYIASGLTVPVDGKSSLKDGTVVMNNGGNEALSSGKVHIYMICTYPIVRMKNHRKQRHSRRRRVCRRYYRTHRTQ